MKAGMYIYNSHGRHTHSGGGGGGEKQRRQQDRMEWEGKMIEATIARPAGGIDTARKLAQRVGYSYSDNRIF